MLLIPRKMDGVWLRKIAFRFKGTFATTDTIEVRGRRTRFTEEALRQAAETMIGTPISMGHRGVRIGFVEKAWYSDGRLQGIGAIFEPQNEVEREAVEQVRSGKVKGLSPAISYDLFGPAKRRVVVHGSLKVVGENEDGSLIVEAVFTKEDMRRAGIDDLKNIKLGRFWIHNGSEEAKKKIEEDAQRWSVEEEERTSVSGQG